MLWLALGLLLAADYTGDVQRWREARERGLQADNGWLTVTGLFWLREGNNPLPAEAGAARGTTFRLLGGKVWAGNREIRPNSSDAVEAGGVRLYVIRRGTRFGVRMKDPGSRFRREFRGLKWYPVKSTWCIEGQFVADPRRIPILNAIGQTEPTDSPGYVVFRVAGKELRLRPLDEGGHLFFVFRDLTAGKETYGAGRFLDTDPPRDGRVVLDFNKAYNPPCAFTPYATCPLPPKENRLPVRVAAGELNYRAGHTPLLP